MILLLVGSVLAGCSARLRRFPEGGPRVHRPSGTWGLPSGRTPAAQPVDVLSLQGFIRKTNRTLAPDMVERIAASLQRGAQRHDLDVRIVTALIARESSFNPRAVSPTGALGLGQLLPSTARWLEVQDPFDPDQNLAGVFLYVKKLSLMWPGPHWERVLASYFVGQGTVQRSLATTGTLPPTALAYARDILQLAEQVPVKLASGP